MQKRVTKHYDSEAFRADAHSISDLLADYLKNATQARSEKMFCAKTPEQMLTKFKTDFKDGLEGSNTDATVIMEDILNNITQLHHPHFLGHQVSAPLPSSALAEFCASLFNNSNCVWEMGPAAAAIEKTVIDWMNAKVGYDKNSGGFLTSGGSLGNLTALLAARQAKADFDVWKEGACNKSLCILASAQCHYSVKRAAAIMGLGENGVISIPVDTNYHTRLDSLETEYNRAIKNGKQVIAVVANACSTATGSYDNLSAIADFCEKHGLWLHVDGAHGASALLSETHKHLLKGIERADSVVWDGHKMMMTSALVTAVLFKNGKMTHQIFSQNASYLLDRDFESNWYDYGLQTLECTKPFMSLKMYVSLKLYGERFFGDYIDYVYALTEKFAQTLADTEDFEIATMPQSNIICFRYVGGDRSDELNIKIRENLLKSEKYYIVKTELGEKTYLRCTIINPNTSLSHLLELISDIRKIAQEIEK